MIYKVRMYVDLIVQAEDDSDAIGEAETKLGEEMENHLFNVSEWFNSEILEKGSSKRQKK